MRDQPNEETNLSRRAVLQTAGASTVVLGSNVVGATRAEDPGLREIVEQGHQLLDATQDLQRYFEFLRNRGVGVAKERGTMEITKQTADDAGTQRYYTDEISLTFGLYSDCNSNGNPDGTYSTELFWEYETTYNFGELPLDYMGIAWRDGAWDYETDSLDDLFTSSSEIEYIGGSSPEGPGWEFGEYNLDPSEIHYAGVHIDWIGDEPDEDTLSASYSHTWKDVEVTGVSVSYPAGISVSVSDVDKEFTKDYNDDGEFLRLSKYDATTCV